MSATLKVVGSFCETGLCQAVRFGRAGALCARNHSDNTSPISTEVYLDTIFGTYMFPAWGTKPPTAVPRPSCTPNFTVIKK
jgi:hypothetical protein